MIPSVQYVYPEQLAMYPKMKHKVDRYVRYVNIVNVVIYKNTNIMFTFG